MRHLQWARRALGRGNEFFEAAFDVLQRKFDLLSSNGMRRRFQLLLQLRARQSKRFHLAMPFGVERRLIQPLFALGSALVHSFLYSCFCVD